jgi:hypothetical protein
MLRRQIVITVIVIVVSAVAVPAYAGHHPLINVTSNNNGVVGTAVVAPGHDGSHSAATVSDSSGTASCRWVDSVSDALPHTVHLGPGTWLANFCLGRGQVGMPIFVPAGQKGAARLLVTPGALAQRAANELHLPTPVVGRNPTTQALVNLPEWFWIPRNQWHPLTQRTAAGGVWAVVTARPVSTSWNPGNGSQPVTCWGPGTPYDTSVPVSDQTTTCSYTYPRSSADQPQTGPNPNDRFFTVTVTTKWSVSWVGAGGAGGALPVIARTTTFPLAVAQRETVVTSGSG